MTEKVREGSIIKLSKKTYKTLKYLKFIYDFKTYDELIQFLLKKAKIKVRLPSKP